MHGFVVTASRAACSVSRVDDAVGLRNFRAIEAVARTGSVARAAESLGWSQPTVHHHLARLERALGAPLVEKGPTGSHLTPMGMLARQHGADILRIWDSLQQEIVAAQREDQLSVKLGAFPTIGSRILPLISSRVTQRPEWQHAQADGSQPRLEITVDESAIIQRRILEGDLDLAIVFAESDLPPHDAPDIDVSLLYLEPVWLCLPATHRLAQQVLTVDELFAELRDEPWVFGGDPLDYFDLQTRKLCAEFGFEPIVGARTSQYAAVIRMIESGMGVAVLPESAIDRSAGVFRARIDPSRLTRKIYLLSRRRSSAMLPSEVQTPRQLRERERLAFAVKHVIEEIRLSMSELKDLDEH